MQEFATPESLFQLLATQGGESYFGEPVTVLEHSLQAAYFACQANSSETLIAAALLHDIGHLLHLQGEDAASHGQDTHHEELADAVLSAHMPSAVTEPIRLHVAAKRYLCHIDSAYLKDLSPSSLQSLILQGGPMSEIEAKTFISGPFGKQAVTLRYWDDKAKIAALPVPSIDTYLSVIKILWQ